MGRLSVQKSIYQSTSVQPSGLVFPHRSVALAIACSIITVFYFSLLSKYDNTVREIPPSTHLKFIGSFFLNQFRKLFLYYIIHTVYCRVIIMFSCPHLSEETTCHLMPAQKLGKILLFINVIIFIGK